MVDHGCFSIIDAKDPQARGLAEMLVDENPLHTRNGDIGSLPTRMGMSGLLEELLDFLLLILSDHACRIGAASTAMGHLGQKIYLTGTARRSA